MDFFKTIWKNKRLVWQLGKNDFKNKFAATSLGAIWGFLQPFVFMATYAIVFQYILKTEKAINSLKPLGKYYLCKDERIDTQKELEKRGYEIDTKLKVAKREFKNGKYIDEVFE